MVKLNILKGFSTKSNVKEKATEDLKENKVVDKTSNGYIINQIKNQDITPFIGWMKERNHKYYKIGWTYLYNHHDIEDVLQTTIIKVYNKVDQLKEEQYFETWVTSILINECKSLLRKRGREKVIDYIEAVETPYEDTPLIEFKEVIDQLEDFHREVIILKYITGYSQEEIASILDIPVGTVKSRIYRGLKHLRECIGKEGY